MLAALALQINGEKPLVVDLTANDYVMCNTTRTISIQFLAVQENP